MPAFVEKFDRRNLFLMAMLPAWTIGLLNHLYLESVARQSTGWFYAADLAQWVLVPFLVWFFVLRPANIKPKDYGFRSASLGAGRIEATGLFLFAVAVLVLVYEPVRQFAYQLLWPQTNSFGYGSVVPRDFPLNFLVVFYFSATAALVEEIAFRGLAWNYFSIAVPPAHRKVWYVLVTSAFFAATHSEQGPDGVIAAFTYGVAASWLYTRIGSLWPLVFGHFVIDLYSFWPN